MGSRNESDSPDAWTTAWPGRGPRAMKQVVLRVLPHALTSRKMARLSAPKDQAGDADGGVISADAK